MTSKDNPVISSSVFAVALLLVISVVVVIVFRAKFPDGAAKVPSPLKKTLVPPPLAGTSPFEDDVKVLSIAVA